MIKILLRINLFRSKNVFPSRRLHILNSLIRRNNVTEDKSVEEERFHDSLASVNGRQSRRILQNEARRFEAWSQRTRIQNFKLQIQKELNDLNEAMEVFESTQLIAPQFIAPYNVVQLESGFYYSLPDSNLSVSSLVSRTRILTHWKLLIGMDEFEEILRTPYFQLLSVSFSRLGVGESVPRFMSFHIGTGKEYNSLLIMNFSKKSSFRLIENVMNYHWSGPDTILLTRQNECLRPDQLIKVTLSPSLQTSESLIYHEVHEERVIDLFPSNEKSLVYLNERSSSEVRVLDGDNMSCIHRRLSNVQGVFEFSEGFYYRLLSHLDSGKQSLSRLKENSDVEAWEEIFSAQGDEHIEEFRVSKEHVILHILKSVKSKMAVLSKNKGDSVIHEIEMGIGKLQLLSTNSSDPNKIQFLWETPIQPLSMHELDLSSGKITDTLSSFPVPIARRLELRQIKVPSLDKTVEIPVTLVLPSKGKCQSIVLNAYGSYGLNVELDFKSNYLPLLERGIGIAHAHIRGGSELGRSWYEAGRLERKKNTVDDLDCVSKYLVREGYCQNLAGIGISAGALPFAAVYNRDPSRFRAIVLRVPLLDPLTLMKMPDIPLTTIEYAEWGNPATDSLVAKCLESYSPYQNLVPKTGHCEKSKFFISASTTDERIPLWQVLKWNEKRKKLGGDEEDAIIKITFEGNHYSMGSCPSHISDELAFLCDQLLLV